MGAETNTAETKSFTEDSINDLALEENPKNVELQVHKDFIVAPEHRASGLFKACTTSEQIPVIDLGLAFGLQGLEQQRTKIVEQVGKACEEWGFFQVTNHGVPEELIQSLKREARFFFELPLEQKLAVKRNSQNALGYNDGELTKNVRDWKEVFDVGTAGCQELPVQSEGDGDSTVVCHNQWPPELPNLRKVTENYITAAEKLAFTLLELIAESLGLQPQCFHDQFKSSRTSLFRLNHYAPCPAPNLVLGVSRHKDIGALTILLQDEVGGLEVKRKDGEWIGVKPDPTALVINVGDLIQVYSNDKYQSVEHRVVVNQNVNRYSFPLFFNPQHSIDVAPIPELTAHQHPPRYKSFNWGKYIKRRNDSNFKNLGVENIQICHYAINV